MSEDKFVEQEQYDADVSEATGIGFVVGFLVGVICSVGLTFLYVKVM